MERPTFLTQKDREMIESLGGETYELEDEFTSQELHYSDKGGHRERSEFHKKVAKMAGTALIALGLSACVPQGSEGYYLPFTDQIVYTTDKPSQHTIDHEEEHRRRANEMGRIRWGLQYMISPDFRCSEEMAANERANILPVDNHPACQN